MDIEKIANRIASRNLQEDMYEVRVALTDYLESDEPDGVDVGFWEVQDDSRASGTIRLDLSNHSTDIRQTKGGAVTKTAKYLFELMMETEARKRGRGR